MHQTKLARYLLGIFLSVLFTLEAASPSAIGRLSDYKKTNSYYRELHRPQFHFTPQMNWMNDPNGMVYYDGEYHLFYQHNPHGNTWGHMSWGHAVSKDLVHWEHLPIALQDQYGVMIFSGSTVVDFENTSGFGNKNIPPLVAIYTGHGHGKQTQDIAYSNDRGRTWTKYAGNPVIDLNKSDFRDPKVFWHNASGQWIMTVSLPRERKVRFYGSPNLKEWNTLSDFGPAGAVRGIWECPDLFPLKMEDSEETKWVLIVNIGSGAVAGGSGCQYFIGDFDGRRFRVTQFPNQTDTSTIHLPQGRLLADFEGQDFDDWKASGPSFAKGPVRNQDPFSGYQGKGLATSWGSGDKDQGILRSPDFEIDGTYLNFLIGGGNHPGEACFNLVIDGEVVRTATGTNSGLLNWHQWNLEDLKGKRSYLELVDRHSGGWGQIFVDHIVLGNTPFDPPGEPAYWVDFGKDFYAAVSWANVPEEDGRRLWLGWMSNWQYANQIPTHPWRSAMSIPRSLTLRRSEKGLRLIQTPVNELDQLQQGEKIELSNIKIPEGTMALNEVGISGKRMQMTVDFRAETASEFGLIVRKGDNEGTIIGYDVQSELLFLDRKRSGNVGFHDAFPGKDSGSMSMRRGRIKLNIFLDDSSVEIFGNDGMTVISSRIFPSPESTQVEIYSKGGSTLLESMHTWKLKSIWHE